jgi:hypothetical protein
LGADDRVLQHTARNQILGKAVPPVTQGALPLAVGGGTGLGGRLANALYQYTLMDENLDEL